MLKEKQFLNVTILTPEQQLVKHVETLQGLGFEIELTTDRGYGKRAYISIGKKGFGLEFIVKGSEVFIGLKVFREVSKELREQVVHFIETKGYVLRDVNQKNVRIETDDHVSDIQDLAELLSGLDYLEDATGSSWKRTADLQTRLSNIVSIIQLATTTGDTTLLKRDMVDDVTPQVSVNLKTDVRNYGEHLVPIDFMFQYSVTMFKQGASHEAVLDFWKRNLKVAYITKDEAYKLDVEFKLRTCMTEGWQDGDSAFARVEFADIEIV